jgi:hypothetical protein
MNAVEFLDLLAFDTGLVPGSASVSRGPVATEPIIATATITKLNTKSVLAAIDAEFAAATYWP